MWLNRPLREGFYGVIRPPKGSYRDQRERGGQRGHFCAVLTGNWGQKVGVAVMILGVKFDPLGGLSPAPLVRCAEKKLTRSGEPSPR